MLEWKIDSQALKADVEALAGPRTSNTEATLRAIRYMAGLGDAGAKSLMAEMVSGAITLSEEHAQILKGDASGRKPASIVDVFSYLHHHDPMGSRSTRRLIGMAYLADWKSCLLRGHQISDVIWAFLGGPTPYEQPALPHGRWNLSSSGKLLGRDWPTLSAGDFTALDHVLQQTRDLSDPEFTRLVQSTYPALTSDRTTPLDLSDLAQRYQASN